MSIRIEVKSSEINVKQVTSTKNGKPYTIREQDVWAFFVDQKGVPHPYPQRMRISLDDHQEPYQPGNYTLSPTSFYLDRYQQLSVRARLQPIPTKQA